MFGACQSGPVHDEDESTRVTAFPSGERTMASLRRSQMCAQPGNSRQDTVRRRPKRRKTRHIGAKTAVCALLASTIPTAMAQSCIPLASSRTCPSFNASSISTDSFLVGLFPFLSSVTSVSSFDSGLDTYIANGFTQTRYVRSEDSRNDFD